MTSSVASSKDGSYDSLFSPLTSVDLQTYRCSPLPLPISTCSFCFVLFLTSIRLIPQTWICLRYLSWVLFSEALIWTLTDRFFLPDWFKIFGNSKCTHAKNSQRYSLMDSRVESCYRVQKNNITCCYVMLKDKHHTLKFYLFKMWSSKQHCDQSSINFTPYMRKVAVRGWT